MQPQSQRSYPAITGVPSASRFACLAYHALAERGSAYTLPEQEFRRQMEFLKGEGCVTEGFEELHAHLLANEPLPQGYVLLTFDDGDQSALRVADILLEFGFRASFFVTRDKSLKAPGFLRPREIRQLRGLGFSLGAHGITHRRLSQLGSEECVAELRESKKWLEDLLGEPVRYMSPPHGAMNQRVYRLAIEQGYRLIATSNESMNRVESLRLPGTVSRVAVRRHSSLLSLRYIVSGNMPFYFWRKARRAALVVPKALIAAAGLDNRKQEAVEQ